LRIKRQRQANLAVRPAVAATPLQKPQGAKFFGSFFKKNRLPCFTRPDASAVYITGSFVDLSKFLNKYE
jgi:hypothetical protein